MTRNETIALDGLSDKFFASIDECDPFPSFRDAKRAFEVAYTSVCLERAQGNVTQAAIIADKDRKDFYDLAERCEVEPDWFRS